MSTQPSFTTDFAPTVTTTTPINGTGNVAVTSNITVNFSELVNVTGIGAFDLDCTGSLNHPITLVGTNPSTTQTLDPISDLPIGANCTVTVLASSVTDNDTNDPPNNLDGNADGIPGDNYVFSFSTLDIVPDVTTITPADAAT